MKMKDSRYQHSEVKCSFWRTTHTLIAMSEQMFFHSSCVQVQCMDVGLVSHDTHSKCSVRGKAFHEMVLELTVQPGPTTSRCLYD